MDDMFRAVEASLRVTRYEECERLHSALYDMSRDFEREADDEPMRAKHEDRELTHKEVWQGALSAAMMEIDERMGRLSQG